VGERRTKHGRQMRKRAELWATKPSATMFSWIHAREIRRIVGHDPVGARREYWLA